MVASHVLDRPVADMAGDLIHAFEITRKILLSTLLPEYDVRRGSLPSDVEMGIEELLRPVILKISDLHLGLSNAYVAKLYEMRSCIIPQFVTRNGDDVDLQALERDDVFLNIEALCLLDQANWLQAEHGTHELNTEGNHDQKLILAVKAAFEAGLNIFRGIRIRHPKQRDVVQFHSHHFDSKDMLILPMRIAAGIYDDMVSKGEDGAATAKIIMKVILGGLGYEAAYKYISYMYDANLEIGHLHLMEFLKLQYEEKITKENLWRGLINFLKNSFISFILSAHRTGALEAFIKKDVIPAFRKATEEVTGKATAAATKTEAGPNATSEHKTTFTRTAQHMLLRTAFGVTQKGLPAAIFARAARQMLDVLEKDPSIGFLKDLSLKKLRPPLWRKKTPAQTPSGWTAAWVEVLGCWIDKRATFGAVYKDGVTRALDWMKMREAVKEKCNLPDEPLTGDALVQKHFSTYKGFHPRTLEQLRFLDEQKGVLSDEATRENSVFPRIEDMATITISETGEARVEAPAGRPPPVRAERPADHEIIYPYEILNQLEVISPRAANDLWGRMNACPALRILFHPEEQHAFQTRSRPFNLTERNPSTNPVGVALLEL